MSSASPTDPRQPERTAPCWQCGAQVRLGSRMCGMCGATQVRSAAPLPPSSGVASMGGAVPQPAPGWGAAPMPPAPATVPQWSSATAMPPAPERATPRKSGSAVRIALSLALVIVAGYLVIALLRGGGIGRALSGDPGNAPSLSDLFAPPETTPLPLNVEGRMETGRDFQDDGDGVLSIVAPTNTFSSHDQLAFLATMGQGFGTDPYSLRIVQRLRDGNERVIIELPTRVLNPAYTQLASRFQVGGLLAGKSSGTYELELVTRHEVVAVTSFTYISE